MKMKSLTHSLLLSLALFTVAFPLRAQEEDDFAPRQGTPPAQRTGGASRGGSSDAKAASVSVLAPAGAIGLTTRAQPVIYLALSADSSHSIDFAITDPGAKENPVVETTLKGPLKAGLHRVDVAKLMHEGKPVKLEPGVRYEVSADVAANDAAASENSNATCRLMRIDPKETAWAADAEKQSAEKRAASFGKQGVWFDYLDAISLAIDANPKDDALLQKRAKSLAAQKFVWNADGTVSEMPKEKAAK